MLLQELWLEYGNVAYNTVYHAFARNGWNMKMLHITLYTTELKMLHITLYTMLL